MLPPLNAKSLASRNVMHEEGSEHGVLTEAWRYDIEAVRLDVAPRDGGEPYLDMRLTREGDTVHLRFWSPREVSLSLLLTTGGLMILDISGHGMENLGVRVLDFEASNGGVTFYARAVERRRSDGDAG